MTYLTCSFPSEQMSTNMEFIVLLPKVRPGVFQTPAEVKSSIPFQTLYLLHGAFDDGFTWVRNTNISELVDTYQFAVVLPSARNSFYLDDPEGLPYYSFLTEELIPYTREIFPLSTKSCDTFIGGVSMGGYGAVRCALLRPDLFEKVFSFSGALNSRISSLFVKNCGGHVPTPLKNHKELEGSNEDLLHLLKQVVPADNKLSFYINCGKKDIFLKDNIHFSEEASNLGLPVVFESNPGEHNWKYWNNELESAIQWMLEL